MAELPEVNKGLNASLTETLGYDVWDGEIPRRDTAGVEIRAGNANFPAVSCEMSEGGLDFEENFEDTLDCTGIISVMVFADTLANCLATSDAVVAHFRKFSTWSAIDLGVSWKLEHLLLINYTMLQMKYTRQREIQFLYWADIRYDLMAKGIIAQE